MNFKYFKAPLNEMSDLLDKQALCSLCGKTDFCFELDYTITTKFFRQ